MGRRIRAVFVTCALVALGFTFADSAEAATFTVTRFGDTAPNGCDEACSLREAVRAANARPGTDTIRFARGGTSAVTRGSGDDTGSLGDIDITSNITIQGRGAAATVIDGGANFADRIFHVTPTGVLRLNDVTVRDGNATGAGGGIASENVLRIARSRFLSNQTQGPGGAVFAVDGALAITDTLFRSNAAVTSGGGVAAFFGPLQLTRVTFTTNSSGNFGGGLALANNAGNPTMTATAVDSTFSGNSAFLGAGVSATGTGPITTNFLRTRLFGNKGNSDGGAILAASGGTFNLTDSALTGNTGGNGGGLAHQQGGIVNIERSLIANNAVTGVGGGLTHTGNTMTIRNSTLSGNRANGDGGNLYHSTAVGLVLEFTTITGGIADADNTSSTDLGGGIHNASGPVNLRTSIVSRNVAGNGTSASVLSDCDGAIIALGFSVLGAGCPSGPTDTTAEADLLPLASNGGVTQTHALAPTSPALDRVPAANVNCFGTDQRSAPRPFGAGCDSGAYERVLCRNVLVNVVGTSGRNTLNGTSGADGILGLGGADRIRAGGGNDGVCGGTGNDTLEGQDGADFLDGEAGTDRCIGGPAVDRFTSCESRTQ